jgi:tetratricopeptide (TPR) repeat protein
MRLNPLSPDMERMELGVALAHLLAARPQEALPWAEKAARHRPDRAFPVSILAAVYLRAGRGDEARLAIQQLRKLDPELRLSNFREWLPFQRPQDLENVADALRAAGLPM